MSIEGKEIIKSEMGLARSPDRVISEAVIAVNVFKDVINQKPRKVIINGEQYLEYEDWQTLGEFYRCSAITRDAVPIEVDGVKGAKAHADLVNIDTGVIIGGAEAYCLRDEENWQAKPWFQLASMAQTRAGAKAFRNRLAWVAVMAGYRPTPAEEMIGGIVGMTQREHWCPDHKVVFFKKGKMTSYAHPIEGTKSWCYEKKEETIEPEILKGSTSQPMVIPEEGLQPAPKATTEPFMPIPEGITDEQLTALTEVVKKGVKLSPYLKKFGWQIARVKDLTYDQAARLLSNITEDLKKFNIIDDLKNQP